MNWTLWMSTAFLLLGCASVELSHKAAMNSAHLDGNSKPSDLDLSWELNHDLSSEYFGYFNFNIINHSDKWHALTDMRIRFPDSIQNTKVEIVLGRKLADWYTAQSKLAAIADFNKISASLLVAGIGAGLAATAENPNLKSAGNLMAAGSLTYLSASAFERVRGDLRQADMVPENHVLTDTTWIPPGLFADRWLLLSSTDHAAMGIVDSLTLEYRLEDGTLCSNRIVLRTQSEGMVGRKWQREYFKSLASKSRRKSPSQY